MPGGGTLASFSLRGIPKPVAESSSGRALRKGAACCACGLRAAIVLIAREFAVGYGEGRGSLRALGMGPPRPERCEPRWIGDPASDHTAARQVGHLIVV